MLRVAIDYRSYHIASAIDACGRLLGKKSSDLLDVAPLVPVFPLFARLRHVGFLFVRAIRLRCSRGRGSVPARKMYIRPAAVAVIALILNLDFDLNGRERVKIKGTTRTSVDKRKLYVCNSLLTIVVLYCE